MMRHRRLVAASLGLLACVACSDWPNNVYLDRPGVIAAADRLPWPTNDGVRNADDHNAFGSNVSGLFYQPSTPERAATLWAVRNKPSLLYRLSNVDGFWRATDPAPWNRGLLLHYPDGTGSPDAEGVTLAELDSSAVYVSAERNNSSPNRSRLSVLRYDVASARAGVATHEWDLTPDLPSAPANTSLESIAWIPDSFLTAQGFIDESRERVYDPSVYPDHGAGVFVVGAEATGLLYAFVLDHTARTYQRVASFDSRNVAVMDLSFDREHGALWALCDNHCDNALNVLEIDVDPGSPTRGRFVVRASFRPPASMPNYNNEGLALTTDDACVDGKKPIYWTDDSADHGHSIRRDTLPCHDFF